MDILKVNQLSKTYGIQKVLDGISFHVSAGEFVSLLGPSGCGKSTTLRCIAGLEKPDVTSGDITLGSQIFSNKNIFLEPERRKLGMVFQSYAVWPHLDVFENVAFPLKLRVRENKLSKKEIEKKVFDTLELVKLQGLEKRYGHELSGGQQQRVALARAIAMSPKILLLDEPLSNLDILLREELRSELQRLTRKLSMTTILVTHDQREALSLSHRIILLNKGKIEAEGTPEKLYSSPCSDFVAEFLAGGQVVSEPTGAKKSLVPRLWKQESNGTSKNNMPVTILSRLYLGNEYEYWAKCSNYNESIKFFSPHLLSEGSETFLSYQIDITKE
jgi:iron(III) transport system ATP-binding protein